MDGYYLETSALIKRYAQEPRGTEFVRSLVQPSPNRLIYVSGLVRVEVPAALHWKHRRRDITRSDLDRALSWFEYHLRSEYAVLSLTSETIHRASGLVRNHALTSLDALQLADALRLEPIVNGLATSFYFVCSDRRLRTAAQREGLHALDPENPKPG